MLGQLRRNTWNWLPVLGAIADAGSVAAAAHHLALTPAAVSRTLRLLEDALGLPLFSRVGRGLVLNSHGAALRDALRAATAQVERGLAAVSSDPFIGPLRVASLGVLTESFVVPALIDLRLEHPGLVPEHRNLGATEANQALARGTIDLAFYYEDVPAEGVSVERVGSTGSALYCGRGHPLFRVAKPTRAQILSHSFSVPQIGDTGRPLDGWPSELPRQVGMRITMLRSNLDVCLSGTLLTVLPDVTAAPHLATKQVRRLPFPPLPAIEVFAAVGVASRSERSAAVIERVRQRLAAASQSPRRRRR